MNKAISVSELNEQIKGLLETTFSSIYVEGEISNLTYHNSGHIYFSVKDSSSTISCVMFRGNASYLKFRLELGMKIVISGSITVYAPRGNYQLLCRKIEPEGVGSLALAYEQLKTKLQIKGYFDKSLKKELPKYPKTIYVITSNTGAAIEDMKKILQNRYPLSKMLLLPTLVQGKGAKESIVENIKKVNSLFNNESNDELLIVGRGGGSLEDLWAFNEEIVSDAIHKSLIPIISAVGHESDFLISDMVADIRASTPSNAIEIATPNMNDLRMYADNLNDELAQKFKYILSNKELELKTIQNSFTQHSLKRKFELVQTNINQLKQNCKQNLTQILAYKDANIRFLKDNFLQNNPEKKNKIGYVQVTQKSKIVNIDDFAAGDELELETSKNKFTCILKNKHKLN